VSQEFVTRAELEEFQAKVEAQMRTFMAEVRAQSSAFVSEVRTGIETVGREAREGRSEILDSNRSISERIAVLIQNVDRFGADVERTKNQYDRAAEALAARVGNLERNVYTERVKKTERTRGGKNA